MDTSWLFTAGTYLRTAGAKRFTAGFYLFTAPAVGSGGGEVCSGGNLFGFGHGNGSSRRKTVRGCHKLIHRVQEMHTRRRMSPGRRRKDAPDCD
jgi:hypothetical protein